MCESGLEILQELVHADPSIKIWFDRRLDLEADGDLGLTPIVTLRVVTSCSLDKQSSDFRVMSKREVKMATVDMAISTLLKIRIEDTEEHKEKESAKLTEFLKSPFRDED